MSLRDMLLKSSDRFFVGLNLCVAGANSGAQAAWFGHNVWPLRLELSLVLQQFEECGIFEVRGVRAHFLFVFALKNAWMMCQPQLGYLLDL